MFLIQFKISQQEKKLYVYWFKCAAQIVECLRSKWETLSLNPRTTEKNCINTHRRSNYYKVSIIAKSVQVYGCLL